MQIIVKNTEKIDGEYGEYLKVIYDKDGKENHRNIGGKFKDQWGYFTQGRMIELKYRQDKESGKWILMEIIPATLGENGQVEPPDSPLEIEPENLPQYYPEPTKSTTTPVKVESNITDKDRNINLLSAGHVVSRNTASGILPVEKTGTLIAIWNKLYNREITPREMDDQIEQVLTKLTK